MKNDIIEHLFKTQVIDEKMKEAIYAYYAYVDVHQKTPDIIYV